MIYAQYISSTQIPNRLQRVVILLYCSDLFSNSQQRDLYWLGIGGWVRGVCLLLIFSCTPCGRLITSRANHNPRNEPSVAFNVSMLERWLSDGSQVSSWKKCSRNSLFYLNYWFNKSHLLCCNDGPHNSQCKFMFLNQHIYFWYNASE